MCDYDKIHCLTLGQTVKFWSTYVIQVVRGFCLHCAYVFLSFNTLFKDFDFKEEHKRAMRKGMGEKDWISHMYLLLRIFFGYCLDISNFCEMAVRYVFFRNGRVHFRESTTTHKWKCNICTLTHFLYVTQTQLQNAVTCVSNIIHFSLYHDIVCERRTMFCKIFSPYTIQNHL